MSGPVKIRTTITLNEKELAANSMRLFVKILASTLIEALVICAATRAFVLGSYSLVAATEVAFITQWFWARNISFDDPQSRSWKYGYPAYVIGSVIGAVLGLLLSKSMLGH